MSWVKATKEDAQRAREGGRAVRFTIDGWEIEEQGDLTPQAAEIFRDMGAYASEMGELADRVEEAPSPITRSSDGTYETVWVQCECGGQYLVKSEHERTSAQHRKWLGNDEPEVTVYDMYPKNVETPKLAIGVNKLCPRCGAKNKKGYDYYPDRDSSAANRFPCRRCNGHGVIPVHGN